MNISKSKGDRNFRHARIVGAIVAMNGWFAGHGSGSVVINITESGADVVAVGSGTLNVGGLDKRTEQGFATGVNPANAYLGLGLGFGDYYETIGGPENFGTGNFSEAHSGTGDKFGMGDRGTWLLVPQGYTSGTPLSGTATWTDTTIAGLGLVPGSYVWTWGSGATSDSLTLNIGVIPETSTALLLGVGAAGLTAFRRRNVVRAITSR